MATVSVDEAKRRFAQLIAALESGVESEIMITRNGLPAARLVPVAPPPARKKVRLGLAKGKFSVPDSIDSLDPLIERSFRGAPQ